MPEIGLSGLLLDYPHSGSAVYTRNLAPLLPQAAPELDFRLFLRQAAFGAPDLSTRRLRTPFECINTGSGLGARLDKLTWEVVALPLASAGHRQSVLHSLYLAAPVLASARLVVTIHDLIPLVVPGYHRSRASAVYSRFMGWTSRRADAIITVSEHARSDIVRTLRVAEHTVYVTPEAVDCRFRPDREPEEEERLRARYGLPQRFLLYVGGAEKRKNLEMLVRAWRRAATVMRDREVRLVIVARFPPPDVLYPDVVTLAHELGIADNILFLPAVDEADKPALYRSALAFCFPSRYEGFGFTPLEAMASGVPVIASDAASLPEVVGDGGWLLSPDDMIGWADAMARLVDSSTERDELRRRGLLQAATFSWRRTAQQTVAVYRDVLSQ